MGRYAEDNVVMVTWANHHYHDFVRNWVRNVRNCGVRNFMVGAMDNELLEKLIEDEVPTFAMQSGLTTEDFGWGTENFHKMGRKKIELIYLFTKMGFDILVSDVDTVWLRNPLPYMAKYPNADVLTSSDHLSNTAEGEGLENPNKAHSAANIGIMLLRHTAKELAKEWVDVLEKDDKVWDQNVFNDLYRRGGGPSVKDDKNLVTGYDGKLKGWASFRSACSRAATPTSSRGCTRRSVSTRTSCTPRFSTPVPRVSATGCARRCSGRTPPSTTIPRPGCWRSHPTSRRRSSITRRAWRVTSTS